MGGFRMTQVFTDRIEAWVGVNITSIETAQSNPTHSMEKKC